MKHLCQRDVYGKSSVQIKALVNYYCEKYPMYSDQKIANCLKRIGCPIARRTVTKYRHENQVSSSYDRRHRNSTND